MSRRELKRFLIVTLLLFGPCGAFLAAYTHVPSDEALAARFHEHHDQFERLLVMVSQDTAMTANASIDQSWFSIRRGSGPNSNGIQLSPARVAEYRRILDELDARQLDASSDHIDLLLWARGSALSGFGGGYIWRSTDDTEPHWRRETPIANGWLIYRW